MKAGRVLGVGVLFLAAGCRGGGGPAGVAAHTSSAASAPPAIAFTDVTAAAGLRFRHENGGSGRKYMPETMGSGCAFLDFDGDGWLDLLLLNSRPLAPPTPNTQHPIPICALYRNDRDGTFTDVTAGSGLDVPMAAMGCAVGDMDNDGRDDLYVTCALDPSRLFRNEGGGRFRDVTAAAGVGGNGQWSTSAAWLDYDRDGRLDLFVCRYVRYDLAHDVFCPNRFGKKSYCTPRYYDGLPSALYHNEGGGRFRDASRETGIGAVTAKALGVAVCDVNRDGWPDLYVTSDTTPNLLFRNEGGRRFTEIGTEAGVAFGENGLARAGMGVDAAPVGPRGEIALLVANFSNEPCSFFWEESPEFFAERTFAAGLARSTLLTLGFGAFFFDFDNDGAADIFVANGHVQDDVRLFQNNLSYAQSHQLFRNRGAPEAGSASSGAPAFDDVSATAGTPFTTPRVSRGAAYGDFDNDGDLDLLVNNNNGPCELLRNDGAARGHWLQVSLEGRRSNRDGLGTDVSVTAGSRVLRDYARSGSSYCSASMRRLHFGLGSMTRFDAIEARWPSGVRERWPGGTADRLLTLTEGSGRRVTAPAAAHGRQPGLESSGLPIPAASPLTSLPPGRAGLSRAACRHVPRNPV